VGESDDDEVVESGLLVELSEVFVSAEDVEDRFPEPPGTPSPFAFASAHSVIAG